MARPPDKRMGWEVARDLEREKVVDLAADRARSGARCGRRSASVVHLLPGVPAGCWLAAIRTRLPGKPLMLDTRLGGHAASGASSGRGHPGPGLRVHGRRRRHGLRHGAHAGAAGDGLRPAADRARSCSSSSPSPVWSVRSCIASTRTSSGSCDRMSETVRLCLIIAGVGTVFVLLGDHRHLRRARRQPRCGSSSTSRCCCWRWG